MQFKYIVLLLLSIFIMAGYTYSLDIPQEIETPLRNIPYSFSTDQFNLLYFSTFFLIIFLVIPIGFIIDQSPIKYTLLTLLVLGFISQSLIGLLLQKRINGYIGLILFMRALVGISGQGVITIQGYVISVYGKRQYELLMGLSFSVPYIFDSLSSLITTDLYEKTQNIPITIYIGSLCFVISIIAGFFLVKYIDLQTQTNQNEMLQQQHNRFEEEEEQPVRRSIVQEVKSFPREFWTIILAIFFMEWTLSPFYDNLNELIMKSYAVEYTTTGRLILIPYTGLALLSIIFGKILKEKPEFRRLSYVLGTFFYFGSFLFLYRVPNTGAPTHIHYFAIIMFLCVMSLNFTVYYATLSTAIPYVVSQRSLGTAWAICQCTAATAKSLIPILNTYLLDSTSFIDQSYTRLTYVTMFISIVPLLIALHIKFSSRFDMLDMRYCDEAALKEE